MSEKPRIPYGEAIQVAAELTRALEPFCERIVVAGSLRRKRPTVGDVELLFIPRFREVQEDMFATRQENLVDRELNSMMVTSGLSMRLSAAGTTSWGEKNKLGIYKKTPVDFFATTAAGWWVSLVIRTGGKDTNLALTTGARKLGRSLNAYGEGVTDLRTGKVTPATSERHVFELCGVPYREPEQRP